MVISVLHVRNPRCNQYPTNHHAAFAAPFPIYTRAESGARSPQRDHLLALGLGADCDDSHVDRSSCACIIQCCTVCCVHCSTTQCPVHPACRCLHTHTHVYILYIFSLVQIPAAGACVGACVRDTHHQLIPSEVRQLAVDSSLSSGRAAVEISRIQLFSPADL